MAKGKIILFGKTGEGKSTVANALTTGGIERQKFRIGHGLSGCTSKIQISEGRGWEVTDTVGLGEAVGGTVNSKDAEKKIIKFLKKVRGEYSHVIYVKSSTNRFDVLDEQIWKIFQRIFAGAEEAFTILFTKGDETWLENNWDSFPDWVKAVSRNNVFITDIPPVHTRPVREEKNKDIRTKSLSRLEEDLSKSFDERGGEYATPAIATMDDARLGEESKSILEYINAALQVVMNVAYVAATIGPWFNT